MTQRSDCGSQHQLLPEQQAARPHQFFRVIDCSDRHGQSLGYCSKGEIYLQRDPVSSIDKFSAGDTIGFGINAVRNEVFFTKNGILCRKLGNLAKDRNSSSLK
jgi:hypothetical protein